jgi:hypothetical protein
MQFFQSMHIIDHGTTKIVNHLASCTFPVPAKVK